MPQPLTDPITYDLAVGEFRKVSREFSQMQSVSRILYGNSTHTKRNAYLQQLHSIIEIHGSKF